MPVVPANQPQLIRSSQKDEYYQNNLTNNANELFHTFAGSKRWFQWRKEIELLSDLTYYVLTTSSGELLSDAGRGVCQHHPGGPQQEKNPLADAQNRTHRLPHNCALSFGQGLDLH
ncbi:peroxisome biogenesis factor 10-like [Sinocyclocheilus rhinocerous]|uniref:peroxisome biogenesis factor 10-like n=1 Tax=Sinocyclocheilus rhinocerous TaxID=307959 RepID=UPI0007BAC331|nr:PREDICTED: peroxisome biogenesis factor 10-like [Sinocyclocheilus rhinocerous]